MEIAYAIENSQKLHNQTRFLAFVKTGLHPTKYYFHETQKWGFIKFSDTTEYKLLQKQTEESRFIPLKLAPLECE